MLVWAGRAFSKIGTGAMAELWYLTGTTVSSYVFYTPRLGVLGIDMDTF